MRRDHACAAAGLALAAAYWVAADALPRSALSDAVGAGGLPKLLAFLLAVLSIVIALKPSLTEEPLIKPLRALGVAGLGFLYLAIVPFTGYPVGIALLAGAAALYYGAPARPRVALFAAASGAALWALFVLMLGVSYAG